MWADLRQWLKADMQSEDSRVKQRIANAGLWFGETLTNDASLRASLNEHLEQAAHRLAPDFAAFLTRHISDTVKSWDAKDMSRQIELNIGKDLQFIRVNGTLVGGTIGLILFLLAAACRAGALIYFGRRDDVARRLEAVEDQVHQKDHRQRRHQRKGHGGDAVQIAEHQVVSGCMFCPNIMPMVVMLEKPTPAPTFSITCRRAPNASPRPISGIINSIWLL
jgi:hypothetical protein